MEERKNVIIEILMEYGCATALQIVGLANRKHNVVMTPSQVSAVLRPMVAKAEAASGKDVKGTTAYWLTDTFKEELK